MVHTLWVNERVFDGWRYQSNLRLRHTNTESGAHCNTHTTLELFNDDDVCGKTIGTRWTSLKFAYQFQEFSYSDHHEVRYSFRKCNDNRYAWVECRKSEKVTIPLENREIDVLMIKLKNDDGSNNKYIRYDVGTRALITYIKPCIWKFLIRISNCGFESDVNKYTRVKKEREELHQQASTFTFCVYVNDDECSAWSCSTIPR